MSGELRPADVLISLVRKCDLVLVWAKEAGFDVDPDTILRVVATRSAAVAELREHGTRFASHFARPS